MVNQYIVDAKIDKYGEEVTLITADQITYSKWGDELQTTSSSTLTVIHNDISGDEEFNVEGRYRPGDKVFFAKSNATGLAVGNKILFNSNSYEIKDVITHRIEGKNMCSEIRCSKV